MFHFCFNGTQVLLSRVEGTKLQELATRTDNWLFRIDPGTAGQAASLRFEWPLLLPCIIASALLIGWLIRLLRVEAQARVDAELRHMESLGSLTMRQAGV